MSIGLCSTGSGRGAGEAVFDKRVIGSMRFVNCVCCINNRTVNSQLHGSLPIISHRIIAIIASSNHRHRITTITQIPQINHISIKLLSAGGLRLASKAGHGTRLPTVESSIGLTLFKLSVDHLSERHQSCSPAACKSTNTPNTPNTPNTISSFQTAPTRRKKERRQPRIRIHTESPLSTGPNVKVRSKPSVHSGDGISKKKKKINLSSQVHSMEEKETKIHPSGES